MFSDAKLASQVAPTLMFLPNTIALFLAVQAAITTLGHDHLARILIQCLYFLPWFPFQIIVLDSIYHGGVKYFLKIDPEWAWIAMII